MSQSDNTRLRGLLVDVTGPRSKKLFDLLESLGIELIPRSVSDTDLYQLIHHLNPDIMFVDVNSPARDTLEHVVFAHAGMPKPIVAPDGELRTSLGRLAGEIGISLYVSDELSPALFQALIDITISHCHSIDVLKTEIAKRAHAADDTGDKVAVH